MKTPLLVHLALAFALTTSSCSLADSDPHSRLVEVPTYRLTGVSVLGVSSRDEGSTVVQYLADTLTTSLYLGIRTHADVIALEKVQMPFCPDNADCGISGEIVNPTVPERSSLRFSQSIKYRGRVLEAGANLLEDTELIEAFDGSRLDLSFPYRISPSAGSFLTMKREAFEIPEGWYDVALGWGTASGEIFGDTVRVFFSW